MLLAVVIVTFGSLGTAADNSHYEKTAGFKAGLIAPGTSHRVDVEYSTNAGYSLSLFVDYAVRPTIYVGFSFDLHQIVFDSDKEVLPELSFTMKAKLQGSKQGVIFKPGVGIGYGFIREILSLKAAHFLIVKATGEVAIPVSQKSALLFEASMIGSPLGGNKSTRLTAGPMLLLRAGVTI
ncbi:MAG: hypothetical protein JSV44_11435 [Candidatus Zixiibacteriota bacterium]|nr:MAG: hypothetical protein JSV44_11435 [candidate division Zixibacteria bacterium]